MAQYPDGSHAALRTDLDLKGQVSSVAGSELVAAVLAVKAATMHCDQITDCKSLLTIDVKLKTAYAVSPEVLAGRLGQSNSGGTSLTPRGWYGPRMILASGWRTRLRRRETGVSQNGGVLIHDPRRGTWTMGGGVIRNLQSASLTCIKYKVVLLLQSVKEVVTAETSKAYRAQRDGYRAAALPPPPSSQVAANPNLAIGTWKATNGMSI